MTTYPGALLEMLAPPNARVASRRLAGLITARDEDRDGLPATECRIVLSVREGLLLREALSVREGLSVRIGLLYVAPSRPGLRDLGEAT